MKIYTIIRTNELDNCAGYEICAVTRFKSKAEKIKEIYSCNHYKAEIEEFYDGDEDEISIPFECDRYGLTAVPCSNNMGEGFATVKCGCITTISHVFVHSDSVENAKIRAKEIVSKYKQNFPKSCERKE